VGGVGEARSYRQMPFALLVILLVVLAVVVVFAIFLVVRRWL
jgi:hypothetical protein